MYKKRFNPKQNKVAVTTEKIAMLWVRNNCMRKVFDSPNLKARFLSRGRGHLTHLKISFFLILEKETIWIVYKIDG